MTRRRLYLLFAAPPMLAAQIALLHLLADLFLRPSDELSFASSLNLEFGLFAYALCLVVFTIVRVIDVMRVTLMATGAFFIPMMMFVGGIDGGWALPLIGFIALATPFAVETVVRRSWRRRALNDSF